MKKFAIILTMLLTTLSLFAEKGKWDLYDEGDFVITEDKLKLRKGEGTKAEVITVLPVGTVLQVLEEGKEEEIDEIDDCWVRVKTLLPEGDKGKSYEGWVYGGYINLFSDTKTQGYKNKDIYIGYEEYALDEDDDRSPVMNTFYFINRKTLTYKKSFSFIDHYYGEKRYSLKKGVILDDARNLLYIGLSYSIDSETAQVIYRIDISNPEATDVVISFDKVEGNKNFIKKNVSLVLKNKNYSNGKRECNLPKSQALYQKCSFDSKLKQSLPKDKKVDFLFYSTNAVIAELFFDEKKAGFWILIDVYESDGKSRYATWIE